MTTPTTALDPGAALALLLAGAVSADAAGVLSTYAVIMIGALAGSGWALRRRDPSSRINALWFITLMVVSTTLVTAGLAQLAYHVSSSLEPQWMLGPIALVVAGIGDDWPDVGRWLLRLLGGVLQRRAGVNDSCNTKDRPSE